MATKRFKCPFCEKRLEREPLVRHIQNKHQELIPEGYSAARIVFNTINKKSKGTCVICKNETQWNEKTWRYNKYCSEKCKKEMRKRALENMHKVYGRYTFMHDPEHQEKMLANRRISGTYKYSDGTMFTYTGTYEKRAIEFMDKILHIPSDDIMMPGPTIQYVDQNGVTRNWITDIYYIPYNLIIEVKDGGDHPNTRSMPEYRAKQKAKEFNIITLDKYNYIRLTDNNFAQLLAIFMELRFKLEDHDNTKTFNINEFTSWCENAIKELKGED